MTTTHIRNISFVVLVVAAQLRAPQQVVYADTCTDQFTTLCNDIQWIPDGYDYAGCDAPICSYAIGCCNEWCDPAGGIDSCHYEPVLGSYAGSCDCKPSPILINLEDNSANYHLTSPSQGVAFDVNGDGILEGISWTERDSNIAFLAHDRNGNGLIDDFSELFGDYTPLSNGQRASNGFEALIDLDGGPLASDGRIDASDAIYGQLRLWLDKNHDGVSQAYELLTLQGAGVTTIFTESRYTPRVDKNGNEYSYVGRALINRGGPRDLPRRIFDVFLQVLPY